MSRLLSEAQRNGVRCHEMHLRFHEDEVRQVNPWLSELIMWAALLSAKHADLHLDPEEILTEHYMELLRKSVGTSWHLGEWVVTLWAILYTSHHLINIILSGLQCGPRYHLDGSSMRWDPGYFEVVQSIDQDALARP